MAYDEELTRRVRQVLAARRDISERKMMGALCFMAGGHMCCGVAGSALMVRVGRDAQEQLVAESRVRPMEIGGRSVAGFVLVDMSGSPSDDTIAEWIERGIEFVSTLPRKRC